MALSSMIGLTGFGDNSAGQGPPSVAVLKQHFLRTGGGSSLVRSSGQFQGGLQRGQAGHNGSGARSSSRRRYDTSRETRRNRQPNEQAVRGQPAGPMEEREWLGALEDVKTRISTIERMQRTQSEHGAETRQFVQEIADRLTTQEKNFAELQQSSETVKNHLYLAASNIEQQYLKSEDILPQMVTYHNELQSMLTIVANLNARYVELPSRLKANPQHETENFEIHTGGGRGDDPLQSQDPWTELPVPSTPRANSPQHVPPMTAAGAPTAAPAHATAQGSAAAHTAVPMRVPDARYMAPELVSNYQSQNLQAPTSVAAAHQASTSVAAPAHPPAGWNAAFPAPDPTELKSPFMNSYASPAGRSRYSWGQCPNYG